MRRGGLAMDRLTRETALRAALKVTMGFALFACGGAVEVRHVEGRIDDGGDGGGGEQTAPPPPDGPGPPEPSVLACDAPAAGTATQANVDAETFSCCADRIAPVTQKLGQLTWEEL